MCVYVCIYIYCNKRYVNSTFICMYIRYYTFIRICIYAINIYVHIAVSFVCIHILQYCNKRYVNSIFICIYIIFLQTYTCI
jgi:hypothetical protein